jgi:hypothetical protein
MSMGETGMAEMNDMANMMDMPLPENTLPMMSGKGQFGDIAMGGMFTLLKVRDNIASNNVDPGHYKHPKGSLAYELADDGAAPEAAKQASPVAVKPEVELNVRKPQMGAGHKIEH